MGSIWIVAPLVVAGLGFLFFIGGFAHLFRGRAARAGLGLGGGAIVTIIGLAAGLIGLNMQSYSRLTYERPVAEVRVQLLDPAQKLYIVTVVRKDGSDRVQSCRIQGDAWLLTGRVQKWKPWAVELGMNATYTLDQVVNYYYSGGNGRTITSCEMEDQQPKINHFLPETWVNWMRAHMLVEDRRFGSATFMPLADGAVYDVMITQDAFNAQPANDAARRANNSRAF